MCKITSIKRQQRNKGRISLFVDSEYFGSLDEKTFLESGLKTGDALTEERWEVLFEQAEKQSAFNRGIFYISKIMRSEKQVREYLGKKGYDSEPIEYAIGKMFEYNYIDDEAFGKMILSHQINVKHAGIFSAKAALIKKGISNETADMVLSEYSEDLQFENAKKQYEKLIKKYQTVEDQRIKKQKISQSMARKGFDWEMINRTSRFFEDIE